MPSNNLPEVLINSELKNTHNDIDSKQNNWQHSGRAGEGRETLSMFVSIDKNKSKTVLKPKKVFNYSYIVLRPKSLFNTH